MAAKQRRLKTNFVINVIGTGLPLAVTLITAPLYIAHIGTARFGAIAIVWILLGYFGLIDFGFSRASANALAKLVNASRKERVAVFMTSLYLNLALGITGGFTLYLTGGFLLRHILKIEASLAVELAAALPWVAILFPALMLTSVCRGAIESKENFFVANLIDTIGYVFGQILPLLAAIFIAPTLPVVLAATCLARIFAELLAVAFVAITEKIDRLGVFDRNKFRELIGYGAWAGVTSLLGPVLQFIDQLLVGSVLGAKAIAHYTVPMNLVARSQLIAGALSRATFPRFSRLPADKALELGESATVSLGFFYGALCGAAIAISKPFMNLWMGPEFALDAAPVLEIVLMGAWINGVAFIPYGLLQGQGRPEVIAKLHAMEVVPYAVLLWFMVHKFGIFGAAIAWSIRVAIDALLLLALAGFRIRHMIGLAISLSLMLSSYALTIKLSDISWIWSIALACSVFLVFFGFSTMFDPNVRRLVSASWSRLFD